MKYHGLGRGLGALIVKKDGATIPSDNSSGEILKNNEAVFYIEIEKIHPNPQQPRKEFNEAEIKSLADSVLEHGIIQPLVVTKVESPSAFGMNVSYQLIAGERRLRAARLAGLLQVPVVVRKTTPKENLEIAIIENIQRSDLNAMEKALAYNNLMEEYSLSQQEVANRVGKSRESVANTIRLLALPQEIKDAISSSKINEGHARAILMVKDYNSQMDLFYKILNMGLNVREVENIARTVSTVGKKLAELSPQIKLLASKIEDAVGTKVSIQPRAKGGRVVIEYYDNDGLSHIASKICGNDTSV